MILTLTGTGKHPLGSEAEADTLLATGFGEAQVYCDGVVIYDEADWDEDGFYQGQRKDIWTIAELEAIAEKQPESSWIVWLYAPLWSMIYKRSPEGKWLVAYAGMGFADDENAEKDRAALSQLLKHQEAV